MESEHAAFPMIYIVLATFEGAAHVAEQIASIRDQRHDAWHLLVRDDGSNDGTVDILDELAAEDERIEILRDDRGRLGVDRNFSLLLETALSRGADWVAISDQDDVWRNDKLTTQIDRLQAFGAIAKQPVLLHGDLEVVGPHLESIHPSLHRSMRIRHEEDAALATLLIQNFVTGCTCMASRALLERALPIPDEAVVYDWWLALCAAAYGRIVFAPDSTVLYRQHSSNQVGVKPYSRTLMKLMARVLKPRRHDNDELLDTIRQASVLRNHLTGLATDGADEGAAGKQLRKAQRFVSEYVGLYEGSVGRIQRVRGLHRLRIGRQDPILDASLKLKLLTTPIELPRSQDEETKPHVVC